MNEDNLLKNFFRRITAGIRSSQKLPAQGNSVMLKELMNMLDNTEEVELSCAEVFNLIDQYAELELSGEDAANLLPLVKKHLDKCKDCHDEYEALERVLKATSALSA